MNAVDNAPSQDGQIDSLLFKRISFLKVACDWSTTLQNSFDFYVLLNYMF